MANRESPAWMACCRLTTPCCRAAILVIKWSGVLNIAESVTGDWGVSFFSRHVADTATQHEKNGAPGRWRRGRQVRKAQGLPLKVTGRSSFRMRTAPGGA